MEICSRDTCWSLLSFKYVVLLENPGQSKIEGVKEEQNLIIPDSQTADATSGIVDGNQATFLAWTVPPGSWVLFQDVPESIHDTYFFV
jgi:hypothetical protein